MRPSDWRTLLALAAVTGVVAWLAVRLFYSDLPPAPRLAPMSLVLLACAEMAAASSVRSRIAPRAQGRIAPRAQGRPMPPIVIARIAALAKASALVAALALGVWAGLLAYTLAERDRLVAARPDSLTAGFGVLAALALLAAALWLERSCRTPDLPRDRDDLGLPA